MKPSIAIEKKKLHLNFIEKVKFAWSILGSKFKLSSYNLYVSKNTIYFHTFTGCYSVYMVGRYLASSISITLTEFIDNKTNI